MVLVFFLLQRVPTATRTLTMVSNLQIHSDSSSDSSLGSFCFLLLFFFCSFYRFGFFFVFLKLFYFFLLLAHHSVLMLLPGSCPGCGFSSFSCVSGYVCDLRKLTSVYFSLNFVCSFPQNRTSQYPLPGTTCELFLLVALSLLTFSFLI